MTVPRAQAHALEAAVAAMVLLINVTSALQVIAVMSLTASTPSQHTKSQRVAVADGVLTVVAETGMLKRTVLLAHPENGSLYDTDVYGYYIDGGPPTAFGEAFGEPFLDRGVAFNVHLYYLHNREVRRTTRLVYMDEPSDHAVSRTRLVAFTNDDALIESGMPSDNNPRVVETTTTLKSVAAETNETYFIQGGNVGPLYAVVNVEVVVWRM